MADLRKKRLKLKMKNYHPTTDTLVQRLSLPSFFLSPSPCCSLLPPVRRRDNLKSHGSVTWQIAVPVTEQASALPTPWCRRICQAMTTVRCSMGHRNLSGNRGILGLVRRCDRGLLQPKHMEFIKGVQNFKQCRTDCGVPSNQRILVVRKSLCTTR